MHMDAAIGERPNLDSAPLAADALGMLQTD